MKNLIVILKVFNFKHGTLCTFGIAINQLIDPVAIKSYFTAINSLIVLHTKFNSKHDRFLSETAAFLSYYDESKGWYYMV